MGTAQAQELLSEDAIAQQLQTIPDWLRDGDVLLCTYELTDFVEAIAFVNTLVEPAESLGHHPDLAIAYNRVTLLLTTHDAGGLTSLDFALAEAMPRPPPRKPVSPDLIYSSTRLGKPKSFFESPAVLGFQKMTCPNLMHKAISNRLSSRNTQG